MEVAACTAVNVIVYHTSYQTASYPLLRWSYALGRGYWLAVENSMWPITILKKKACANQKRRERETSGSTYLIYIFLFEMFYLYQCNKMIYSNYGQKLSKSASFLASWFKWRFFCRVGKSRNDDSQGSWWKGHSWDPLPKWPLSPKGFWPRTTWDH